MHQCEILEVHSLAQLAHSILGRWGTLSSLGELIQSAPHQSSDDPLFHRAVQQAFHPSLFWNPCVVQPHVFAFRRREEFFLHLPVGHGTILKGHCAALWLCISVGSPSFPQIHLILC